MGGSDSEEQRVVSSPRANNIVQEGDEIQNESAIEPHGVVDIHVSQAEEHQDDEISEMVREADANNESTDAFQELKVDFPKGYSRYSSRRSSVSAEVDKDPHATVTKKYVPKSPEAIEHIRKVLEDGSCFLFTGLDEEQKTDILNAVQVIEKKEGDIIINQWDDGDNFYIVAKGKVEVYKSFGPRNDPGELKYIYTYQDEGYFGELALMYNSPRTATIKACSDVILYALDRVSFQNIIIESTRKKRMQYEKFISSVPLLTHMKRSDLAQIADTIGVQHFKKDSVIIREGDRGEAMFFIEDGQATVKTNLSKDEAILELERLTSTGEVDENIVQKVAEEKEVEFNVRQLGRGDYFGERALMIDEPRSATVTADTDVTCLVIRRDIFERLFGPLTQIMTHRFSTYKGI